MSQETFSFQAEIKQLLNILVHSLYTDREIFLRELISNASDALNRVQFEMLTNREVVDPDAELAIRIKPDEDAGTLTISDTGIGMTREDMLNNLGVIARSGAKAFIEAMKDSQNGSVSAQEVIGQFGVGFYSIFMVADKVQVISKSHLPNEVAHVWKSDGGENYTIEATERAERGTDVVLYLKDDAKDFLQEWNIKQVIRKHSDYIAFPIYVGDEEEATNKQAAIWRQQSSEVSDEQYQDFYKMLTMDFMGEPLHRIHMRADVPLQFYALLYVPSSAEPNPFSQRKEPGLKLYARKVLIQEYSKDLLPEYLQFVQGVVDSEDLPLNVSRESYQANTVMANLKKTLTTKVLNELTRMAEKRTEKYLDIFHEFSRFIKQGMVVEPGDKDRIMPLLFFTSTLTDDPNTYYSLTDYVGRMAENQSEIYYVIGDDFASAQRSPHLEAFRQRGIEVLYFTDPVDSAMLMGLDEYEGHKFRNVDEADIDLSEIGDLKIDETEVKDPLPEDDFTTLQDRFKTILGERVRDVRASKTMTGSAARLVSDEKGTGRNMFRINRLLEKDYQLPVKILELNPRHPLMHNLTQMIGTGVDVTMVNAVVEQVFETSLLQDGIHPDPAAMASRLTLLMQAATGSAVGDLDFSQTLSVEPPKQTDSGIPGFDMEAMMEAAQNTDIENADFEPVADTQATPVDPAAPNNEENDKEK
jgi:molecular chaperone HtpG